LGIEELVIVTGPDLAAAIVTLKDFVAVCFVGHVESVTFTMKLNEPDAVGVPKIAPDEAVRDNPSGNLSELRLQA